MGVRDAEDRPLWVSVVWLGALLTSRPTPTPTGHTRPRLVCIVVIFKLFGLHQIVIGITVSLLCMAIGSWLGNRRANAADAAADAEMREVFFPEA